MSRKILLKFEKQSNKFSLDFAPYEAEVDFITHKSTSAVKLNFKYDPFNNIKEFEVIKTLPALYKSTAKKTEKIEVEELDFSNEKPNIDFAYVIQTSIECSEAGCAEGAEKQNMQLEMAKVTHFLHYIIEKHPAVTREVVTQQTNLPSIIHVENSNSNILRNFDIRPTEIKIDKLVMHYTACDAIDSLKFLSTPRGVSAHYLVDEEGVVKQLVAEDKIAWHAGISSWYGIPSVNKYSVGIEIVNPGSLTQCNSFTKAQEKAVIALAQDIITRHNIPLCNVIGHSDIGPGRKQDPGISFFWRELAQNNAAIFPKQQLLDEDEIIFSFGDKGEAISFWESQMKLIGYSPEVNGFFDEKDAAIAEAFNSRFLGEYPMNFWSINSDLMLSGVIELCQEEIV